MPNGMATLRDRIRWNWVLSILVPGMLYHYSLGKNIQSVTQLQNQARPVGDKFLPTAM
jgi:hypothetical protein